MFFFFSKILHFLILPLTWVFILFLWSVFTRKKTLKKRLRYSSLIILYFFSNSFIIDEAFRIYEEKNQSFAEIQTTYDVAIILGGCTSYDKELELEGFHSSVDRIMHGLKLYKTGKVKKLLLTGGSGSVSEPDIKESLILKHFLLKIGIPKDDIIVESESKNTHENAINSAKILTKNYPNGKFILITSAYHMPRAKKCFDKVGLITTAFSVDQRSGKRKFLLDHLFLPNAGALIGWRTLFHEWIGLISYKILGYI